jgi:hypothetical protein
LGNQEKRRKEAESFIARIEAKYAGQKKGSGQVDCLFFFSDFVLITKIRRAAAL